MKPSVFQFNLRGKSVWGVEFKDALGKKRRRQFPSGDKARAFARGLWSEKVGEAAVPLTPLERKGWERIRDAAARGGWAHADAVAACVALLEARRIRQGLTLGGTVAAFLDAVGARNLRPKTLEQYRLVLQLMVREMGDKPLDTFTAKGFAAWITARYSSEVSRATIRTRLRAWARWCSEPGRAWLPEAFARGIAWDRVRTDAKPIEFLTGPQVAALLAVADPRIRVGLVLVAFAGVRPMEAARLTWESISWDTRSILIPGAVAKTRATRRLHDLPDNVWAWLATVPEKSRKGHLVTINLRNYGKQLLKARAEAGITHWPHDCLRHSFGTHGWHRGAEWVAATMGHVRGFDMLATHYRGCVSAEAARAYFLISP